MISKYTYYFIAIFVLWLIMPFGCVLVILFFVNQIELDRKRLAWVYILLSLSFALLAYTQKSLYYEGTDVERYYYEFSQFIGSDFDIIPLFFSESILTYTFSLINIVLVIICGNVQIISLFWIGITYLLFFISIDKIARHEKICLDKSNILLFLFFSLFGAILFTQVSETIKNAAAFAFFFYLIAECICNVNKWRILWIYILGIGIHSSIIMLFPIFFYRYFNTKVLLIVLAGVVLLAPLINLIELAIAILPDFSFFSTLSSHIEDYALDDGSASSKRYVLISVIILLQTVYLQKENLYNNSNKYSNIALIYLIMMYLNFNNSNAFIRFANFSHFIVVMGFVMLLKDRTKYAIPIVCLLFVFLVTNFQMTYGRTLSGGYCSSYMDNSIIKILFSNIYDYLTYKAYQ